MKDSTNLLLNCFVLLVQSTLNGKLDWKMFWNRMLFMEFFAMVSPNWAYNWICGVEMTNIFHLRFLCPNKCNTSFLFNFFPFKWIIHAKNHSGVHSTDWKKGIEMQRYFGNDFKKLLSNEKCIWPKWLSRKIIRQRQCEPFHEELKTAEMFVISLYLQADFMCFYFMQIYI